MLLFNQKRAAKSSVLYSEYIFYFLHQEKGKRMKVYLHDKILETLNQFNLLYRCNGDLKDFMCANCEVSVFAMIFY